jgi:lysylphosphatidylglycerol synthetase-like protein (DUF2156 family)
VLAWTGLLACMVTLLRGAFTHRPAASDLERAQALLTRYGRSGTAYMTLWQGNSICFGPDRRSYLGYRAAAGVAVVLGDPVGADDAVEPAVAALDRFCQEHGWDHCFYAATPRLLPVYERLGYRALKIGEEALIPLAELALKGKDWQDVRSALNRARREGVTFHLYAGGEAPPPVRAQLVEISAAWLKAKDLPAMGFTLGTVEDVDDPNVVVAVALDRTGQVHGFLDWLPMYAARGWVIDLMRRRADAMPGIMEFLIGSSLLAFKEQGYAVVSLAAAPLANAGAEEDGSPLARVLAFIAERFDQFYHFQSLFAFKRKFQPQWEGVYLIYRGNAELPRIALAILRAHMPELGPRLVAELLGARVVERLTTVLPGRSGEVETPSGGATP